MEAVRSVCAAGGPVFDVCIWCPSRRLQNKPVAVDSRIPFCFTFVRWGVGPGSTSGEQWSGE